MGIFNFWKKKKLPENDLPAPQTIDIIENAVYAHLKPLGFRKHGRTLHRFVSGDISQVIHFQLAAFPDAPSGCVCVNLGIRIPECAQRLSPSETELKKYYPEYTCTIRSRLGYAKCKRDNWYDLSKNTDMIIQQMLEEIDQYVLPAFEALSSREAILANRRSYPLFDVIGSNLILLDECMIYRHLGDIEKAKACFDAYYQKAVDQYHREMTQGTKHYLKKGERIVYMDQDITATEDGYVTVYGGKHAHIDYLDDLAVKLGIRES